MATRQSARLSLQNKFLLRTRSPHPVHIPMLRLHQPSTCSCWHAWRGGKSFDGNSCTCYTQMSCTSRIHLGTLWDSHILYCTKHTFYLPVDDATCSIAPALPSRLKTCFLEPESLSFCVDNDIHRLHSLSRKTLKWEVSHTMLPRVIHISNVKDPGVAEVRAPLWS